MVRVFVHDAPCKTSDDQRMDVDGLPTIAEFSGREKRTGVCRQHCGFSSQCSMFSHPSHKILYITSSSKLLYIYHRNSRVLIISFTGVVPNDLVDIWSRAFRVALVHHSDALELADEVLDTTVDLSTLGPA
jgi:hypothetical protein